MLNLTGEEKEGEALEVVWTSYIGGPAGSSVQGDVARMKAAIDQAFAQSPYLQRASSSR
jgi:hypothetical protein